MSITFRCQHCRHEVKAPDEAAGKRGKCPYCGNSNYIPAPVCEQDILELAPLDEQEERRREAEIHKLFQQERQLLAETGDKSTVPLEHREDLQAKDLYHFVVNYCLDMSGGRTQHAEMNAEKLRSHGTLGRQAVADFLSGKALEPALDPIPARVLQGFLAQLRDRLRQAR